MANNPAALDLTVVDEIDPGKPGKRRYRMAHRDGQLVRLRVLDANSPTFTADFTDSFRQSVRKAIRENRELAKK